ncbi:MAG: dienelactone hydrolase family protein [Planctomycetes bacterium]|nr:dienelactone hydrolase family protein [Planctomycetota bacterium]
MQWQCRDGQFEFRLPTRFRRLSPPPGVAARCLVLGLHGMGQDAERLQADLEPIAGCAREFLLPDGPLPFEAPGPDASRRRGHAWYIYTGDQEAFLASAGLTIGWLLDLLTAVRAAEPDLAGLPVVLLGYSQGGYLAGILAMQHPELFGGLCAINSRLKDELAGAISSDAFPPTLVLHGERDRFIPVERARASAQALADQGLPVTFQAFPSGHSLRPEQIATWDQWLASMGY